jgi:PhnB protein
MSTATEKKSGIPEHYSSVMPYMVVRDGEALIKFLTAVFDAKEILRVDHEDGRLMHAEYDINGGTVMFGQAGGEWPAFPCGMFVLVNDVDGVYAKALANGAEGNQEPGDRGYGRTAGFIDSNGNQWWLNDPDNTGD